MQALPNATETRRADHAASEDDDLRSSLVTLTHLASARTGPEDVLTRVAELAVSAIPGADGAALTLREDGHVDTIVASAPFVSDVYAIEYGIAEGPSITCAAQARTVRSGSLDNDPQWPRFGTLIGHLGVHSALSIPLPTPAGVIGALTVFAHERDAFDERGIRIGELFAGPAAIAVQNAQVLAQAKQLATQLRVALTNQAAIDQACGILMSRQGCSPDQALDQLRDARKTPDEKLFSVALRVVDDAVRRRTKRRRGQPDPLASAMRDLDMRLDYRDTTHATITLSGALNTVSAPVLAKFLGHHLDAGQHYLHLEVEKLMSCDQDGAKVLVDAHHACIAADGALVLDGAGASLRHLFRLAGVDTVLFLARDQRGRRGRWSAPD